MPVREYHVEDEKGSGSRSALEDIKTGDLWQTKDQRSDTRTTFYESDIENLDVSDRRKRELKRMMNRQEGMNEGETYYEERDDRTQQNEREWRRRLVTTYGSQLDLPRSQKERALYLIEDGVRRDDNTWDFGSFTMEEVVLAIINIVAREGGRWIEDEEKFQDLVRDVGITSDEYGDRPDMETMRSLRKMVRDRMGGS